MGTLSTCALDTFKITLIGDNYDKTTKVEKKQDRNSILTVLVSILLQYV